jgi:hypothetical protein
MFLAGGGALAASAPREAAAQEANGLGEKHQLIVSVDRLMPLLSYSSETVKNDNNGVTTKTTDSGTSAAFLFGREPSIGVVHTVPRIAFDFTIIKSLTLGGAFAFAFGLSAKSETEQGNVTRKVDAPTSTIVGFAPRVGYILPIGHVFAFWPRAGFALYSVSTKQTNRQGNNDVSSTDTSTVWSFDLDPQFAWVPVEHFFVHFGPLLNIPFAGSRSHEDVINGASTTTKNDLSVFHFGLSAGLGGWFNL